MAGVLIIGGLASLTARRMNALRSSATARPVVTAGVPVEVAPASKGYISMALRYVGTVVAEDQVQVAPKISARITEVRVKEGQVVHRGEVLARLDDQDLASKVAALRVRLRNAETNLRFQQEALDRVSSLYNEGALPRNELDRAMLARDTAQANRDEVAFMLAEAEANLRNTTLLAPVDGSVAAVLNAAGDMAMPGKPVVTIVSTGRLRAEFNVFERDLLQVRPGQKVALALPDGRTLTSQVSRVDPALNPVTRTSRVEVPLRTEDVVSLGLRPGMSIGGAFIQAETADALVIPKSALVDMGQGGHFVYVERDGKAVRVPVKAGLFGEAQVEIKEGLSPGDRVIVSNLNDLYDGRAVLVRSSQGQGGNQNSNLGPKERGR